jgi:hypothetical protein
VHNKLLVAFPTLSTLSTEILVEYILSFLIPNKSKRNGNVIVFAVIVYDVFAAKPSTEYMDDELNVFQVPPDVNAIVKILEFRFSVIENTCPLTAKSVVICVTNDVKLKDPGGIVIEKLVAFTT